MQFDLRSFLQSAKLPYTSSFSLDLGQEGFGSFRVPEPVECTFEAHPTMEGADLTLEVTAAAQSECARCLEPVEEDLRFTRAYQLKLRDLDDPDFELPLNEEGCLDIRELVYQELIFEVPRVLLCSPDCQGLCPICGKKRAAGCTCQPAEQAAPPDARLSILKQLLS